MKAGGSFLYVGGHELSRYALGGSEPLRSMKINDYVLNAVLALDSSGNLYVGNGDLSYPRLYVYNAHSLRPVRVLDAPPFRSVAVDQLDYVYGGDGLVFVYAPGGTRQVFIIRGGGHDAGCLAFDHSGNLYAAEGLGVSVFTPTKKPGHMKLLRSIREGIHGAGPLTFGPSGDLFVANRSGDVSVFPPGGSKPVQRIRKGVKDPSALAVDSKGLLYVANAPDDVAGWVSVYADGGSKPIREITDGIYTPLSLALDPSDNLYVMNVYGGVRSGRQTVTVYAPGGAKLLRTITHGTNGGQSLIIGSP